MSWHYEWCSENFEAIKQLDMHSNITKINLCNYLYLEMLNALFRITFQHCIRLPISFYKGVMKYIFLVFNVVVFIDFFKNSICWQFGYIYVGVRKWMREFRELNVDVGFETKKMKMERTRMLSSEGSIYIYIYIYHWVKVHRQIY